MVIERVCGLWAYMVCCSTVELLLISDEDLAVPY
jgi:hypothetical protein